MTINLSEEQKTISHHRDMIYEAELSRLSGEATCTSTKMHDRLETLFSAAQTTAPNAETITAMNEYYDIKAHPENYKRYSSFRELMDEVLSEDDDLEENDIAIDTLDIDTTI